MFLKRSSAGIRRVMFWPVLVASFYSPASAETNSISRESSLPQRASHLMQMKLENRDGTEVGKLRNFAVDLHSGEVKFLILSSGGHFGLGAKLHAVPIELFSTATAKREVLAVNLPNGQLSRAPAFKASELASLSQPARQSELARYYNRPEIKPTQIAGIGSPQGEAPRLMPTSRANPNQTTPLQLASDLLGRTVVDRDQHKLGEVLDLLIGFDRGDPAMALISTGRFFRPRGQEYAVSLRALSLAKDGKVMINADRHLLERAPAFNETAWAAATSQTNEPQIFRYFAPH
jgi:sporulation protein YlmC with PRC-barrel domain